MKTNSKLSKKKLSLIIVGSAVLLGGVACAIALPLTYCGPKNPVESPRAIDGSDWEGHSAGSLTFAASNGKVTYEGFSGYSAENLQIPEFVKGDGTGGSILGQTYTVTGIDYQAFYACTNLNGSLTFPKSITTIGEQAFSDCLNLKSISTPGSGVAEDISIGSLAFSSCPITSVDFANTTKKVNIGNQAFLGCGELQTAKFSDLYKESDSNSIGNFAFYECKKLTLFSIEGTSNDVAIGEQAFFGCTQLNDLEFPDATISSIGVAAFYGCASLEVDNIEDLRLSSTYTIASGSNGVAVYKAGDIHAYDSGCLFVGDITDITTDPIQSAEAIIPHAFYGCASLTDISFSSENLDDYSIGEYAFTDCVNLMNITFEGITNANFDSSPSIETYAFSNCANLKNIIFPKVTSTSDAVVSQTIGTDAFDGCAINGYIVFPDETMSGTAVTTGNTWINTANTDYPGFGWTGSATKH